MFTDVVGYSALVNANERVARELLEMHQRLLHRQLSIRRGRHIDNIGDGTLTIFDSALDAAECAVAIQRELQQHNATAPPERRVHIRIGLHQGDVEHGRGGVYGDGVNVCARLEPLSPPGGIAASSMVIAQIHGPLRAHFKSIGAQTLKNIAEPVEVFKLADDDVAAAAAVLGPPPRSGSRLRNYAVAAGVAVAVLAFGAAAWLKVRATSSADEASLAVLPLENLATEPGSAEFVAGLHDSLITEIARTPHLKVISRSSVMRYAGKPVSIPDAARLLRVANVLEGSVQRSGSRVRVNVQLIRADTDEHLWAEVYDRNVEDLFDLQTEIAREIARKIHGRLALPAMSDAERPTGSAEAYELYLRAISREENDTSLGFVPPDEPLRLLEQAVAIDPSFALAYAAIARYAAWGARWATYVDPTRVDGYVVRAVEAAERAMDLKPELPEALLGMGLARYWKDRDPEIAEPFFTRALEKRPGYPAALYMLSGVHDALGNLDRAVDMVRALLDVDPDNDQAHTQLTQLLTRQRRYGEVDRAYARWLQMSENRGFVESLQAQLEFYRSGDLEPWKRVVGASHDTTGQSAQFNLDRWAIAVYEGRFNDAVALAASHASELGWSRLAGDALALAGNRERARPYLETVAAHFRAQLAKSPDDHSALDALGQTQRMLGDYVGALASIERALQLSAPKTGRAPSASHFEYLMHRAQLAGAMGRRDQALVDIDRLLREPSGQHAHAVLRDPYWGSLHDDPEFQERVKSFLPPA
ncbi:MAG: tetratricopeptide repeat protein [Sinimarinibacterium sp.]|jgi:TolB-like protein/class 3 adenylate cyclase/cytochrome c-type biogenesis protein CcmH/NrfG